MDPQLKKALTALYRAVSVFLRQFFVTVPSIWTVHTCQGISLPHCSTARRAAISSPPQQGTSIRSTVTERMLLLRRISASFPV